MTHRNKSGQLRRVLAVVRHPVGGVRTHITYTYPLLMRAGYRFTFIIPEGGPSVPFRESVADWDGAEVIEVPYADRKYQKPKFRLAIRRLLREQRFSFIHSHGMQAAIPSLLANLGIGLPHMMTSHDVFSHVRLSSTVGRLKRIALQELLRRLDVLVAVSEDTRDDHLKHLPGLKKGPCRVVVIPNGVDLTRYSLADGQSHRLPAPPPPSCRQQLGIPPDAFLLGFLGRFMEQKGFLVLVDALCRMMRQPPSKKFHLLAVGSFDYRAEYAAIVAEKPELTGLVTFIDQVPQAGPILRELDLLVMPSLWEACPLLPMEAMLMGTPILGTDCLGLREVLRGSSALTVPPGNPEVLCIQLRRAVDTRLKQDAVDYVPIARKRFDVCHTGKALLDVYEQLRV